jgi:hypothetical protein
MTLIVIVVSIYLFYVGYTYYQTPLEERFYHPRHDWFKPSGVFGHGLGIVGTLMILFGVMIYIARKRYNFLSKLIRLKYLLEFHIFLCTLGPILVLFHTAFKFGGIVSIAFWSMVAVVLSGVIGRFIYIQIPRTIEGRELGLNEVQAMRLELINSISHNANISSSVIELLNQDYNNRGVVRNIKSELKAKNLDSGQRKEILIAIKNERSLASKINRLTKMQQLFKYWHVAHLPFALIMLIVVVIHVIVTLAFGYKWIF